MFRGVWMGFKQKINSLFSSEEKDVKAELDEAEKVFHSRKKKEIENARVRAKKLVSETDNLMEDLEESLEELTEYEDAADIQAVEDVAENFYNSRKRLVENFEASNEIEEHFEALDSFVEDFNDVSRKEGVVMKRVEQSSGVLSENISDVVEHRDAMSELLEQDFRPVNELEQVEKAVEKIRDFEEERDEVQSQLEDEKADIEELKHYISDKKDELDEVRSTEAWKHKEDIEEKLNYLKSKKDDVERELSRNTSNIERGLKKLLYSIENSGTEFEGDKDKLEKLKNGSFSNIEDPLPELEEASKLIEDEDLLDDRQLEKFRGAVEEFKSFEEDVRELEEYRNEIENKKDEFEELEVIDTEDELRRNVEKLKRELEEEEDAVESLENKLETLKQDRDEEVLRLEKFMEKTLGVDVSLSAEFQKDQEA